MKNLSDLKYCDDLVILTSNIIANHLSDLDVEYLAQRTKDGVEINEMTNETGFYEKYKYICKLKQMCNFKMFTKTLKTL